MKKLILLLSCILLQVSAAYAASQLHVVAMDEFKTDKPSKNISVRVLEPSELGRYQIGTNAVLNCQVLRIVDPKRGKRNATFFVKPVSYTDGAEKVSIEEILIDEIENSSTNDWDELCNACSSLIKDAKMTDKDIDNIVKKVKNGTI